MPDTPATAAAPERREPRFVYLCDAPPGGTGRYGWRLDAANHRPLGRAASVHGSLDTCIAAARALRDGFASAQLTVAAGGRAAQWVWRLTLADEPVAVSPHEFARRIECQRAYGHFAEALLAADPAHGVVRNYGPRALRGFDVEISEDRTVCR